MPSTNPFIVDADGMSMSAGPVVQQGTLPSGRSAMNPFIGAVNSTNAAGSSENVAMHIAAVVVLALVGVYVLRGSGFKFVVAVGG